MTSHHDLDSATPIDSVASSPRSDVALDNQPRVRFMCSFGGKIIPRPHDNQLRYAGGDTRIVAVHRHTTFSSLLDKLSKLSSTTNINVKYQLPNEDLDALISVSTDEDVENMMEEYDRLGSKTARLRLFLFSTDEDISRTSSISSLLGGSSRRENWFYDVLNGGGSGAGLERGRSEVSSIFSETPDFLFGLDNSDEPKLRTRQLMAENVSVSDPGSPAPTFRSPYGSTSSVTATIPDLPPVKTKPDNPPPSTAPPPAPAPSPSPSPVVSKETHKDEFMDTGEQIMSRPTGYAGNPMWHYVGDPNYSVQPVQPMPVYYVSRPVPPGNIPVQPGPTYVQQYPTNVGQIPVGFRQPAPGVGQMYGGGMRPVAGLDPYGVVSDGMNQQMYYGVGNVGNAAPVYPGMVVSNGEDMQRTKLDPRTGQAGQ